MSDLPPSTSDLDALKIIERQIKDSLAAVDQRVTELARQQARRQMAATALKILLIIGGLLITLGFATGRLAQVLGGVMSGIVALERVLANVSRLWAITSAKNAYQRIRRSVEARHNRDIIKVVELRDREPKRSVDLHKKMLGALRDDLALTRGKVEAYLAENRRKNLDHLELEDQTTGGGVANTGDL